jgi:hypothetical protein
VLAQIRRRFLCVPIKLHFGGFRAISSGLTCKHLSGVRAVEARGCGAAHGAHDG